MPRSRSPEQLRAVPSRRRIARMGAALRRSVKKPEPWFERRGGCERLERELDSIKAEFPDLRRITYGDVAVLEGAITIYLPKSDGYRSVQMGVVFPKDYPKSQPDSYDIAHVFRAHPGKTMLDRHMSENGYCCLWLISQWNREDPEALVNYLRQLAIFVRRQFIYDALKGRWAGPQWKHGPSGFVQFVRESLDDWPPLVPLLENALRQNVKFSSRRSPCPCGSGRRYEHCHQKTIKGVLRNLPPVFADAVRTGVVSLTTPVPESA
jgi:SEC-C motif